MVIRATFAGQHADLAEIRQIFRDEDGPVGKELDDKTRQVHGRARQLVGVRSGVLLSTLRRGKHEQGPIGPCRDVIAGRQGLTPYLGYHHDPTSPHDIKPRHRKALRFIVNGRVVFVTRVRHPGTRGTRFLTRALEILR